jgi:hypothetical protein
MQDNARNNADRIGNRHPWLVIAAGGILISPATALPKTDRLKQ